MTLSRFQKANFRKHRHTDDDVRDSETGAAATGHPDLAAHNTLGLATQDELDAHAATSHGGGGAFVAARAILNANQTVTNSDDAIAWNGTDTFDTDAIHDPVTNSSRFTVPTGKGGKWRYTVHTAAITSSGTQDLSLTLYVDGVYTAVIDQRKMNSGTVHGLFGSDILQLSAGQYIEFYFSNGGASVGRVNAAGSYALFERIAD